MTSKTLSFSLTPPLRMHHLSGGMGFLLGSNKLGIFLAPGCQSLRPIRIPPNTDVKTLLLPYKDVRVLGRTTYQHLDEMRDPVTPNFIIAALTANNKCLATDQERYWSGVANVFYAGGRVSEGALAKRIASQVRICTRRLESLSKAYKLTLVTIKPSVAPEPQTITSDKYAQHIGTEYRSLLSELYNLRDAITTATSGLKYRCKTSGFKSAVASDLSELGRLFSKSMYDPDGDLLIQRMSLYRSVGQHYLGSNNPLFGDAYQQRVTSGPHGDYHYLVFPLYDDEDRMQAIVDGQPMDRLAEKTQNEAKRFLSKVDHLDALEFSFDCYSRLLRIAETLAKDVGLESRAHVVTDDDILDIEFTDENGKIIRMKRDGTTGKLTEY